MTTKKTPQTAPTPTRDTETSRTIIVRLSAETHRALRIRVAEEDASIQQWVESLVERELGVNKEQPAKVK